MSVGQVEWRQKPEDRRNRFPVRFRRSEEPESSPRLPRVFQVGNLFGTVVTTTIPFTSVVREDSDSFHGRKKIYRGRLLAVDLKRCAYSIHYWTGAEFDEEQSGREWL